MNTFTLIVSIIVGGGATPYLTQLLKLPQIPVAAEKHPKITAAVLSVVAAVIALAATGFEFTFKDIASGVATAVGVFFLATSLYNQAIKSEEDGTFGSGSFGQ